MLRLFEQSSFLMCLLQVFTKVGVEEELMRRATELKKSLEYTLRKHEFLHIDYKNRERRVVSLFLHSPTLFKLH